MSLVIGRLWLVDNYIDSVYKLNSMFTYLLFIVIEFQSQAEVAD